jgi:DNA replication and repair protein RecF
VSGEPSLRRRYLNMEISQISPKYVFDLAGYKKALEQRNRLLKELKERPSQNSGLDAWSEQIVQYGSPLIEKRRFFLQRLAPLADEIHRDLTDGRESLIINYLPSVPLPEEDAAVPDAFRQEIARVGAEELRRGITLVGPQRDEVQFVINGMDARIFGSMGQVRTVVLSLKLAQFRLMEDYVGEQPVLLLDDVMSDLDDRRRSKLLEWIQRKCQTFVTCTSLRSFPEEILSQASIFGIKGGMVVRCEQTAGVG